MKNKYLVVLLTVFTFTATSCLKDSEVPYTPHATLRLVNAYSGAQSLTYSLDATSFHNGIYESIRFYDVVRLGNSSFKIIDDSQKTLLDTTYSFEEMNFYSSLTYGTERGFKSLFTRDTPIEMETNQAGIRLLNLANNTGRIDFYIGEEKIEALSNRPQETTSTIKDSQKFVPIAAGSISIYIKDAEGNELIRTENRSALTQNHYTVVLIGTKESEANPLRILSY